MVEVNDLQVGDYIEFKMLENEEQQFGKVMNFNVSNDINAIVHIINEDISVSISDNLIKDLRILEQHAATQKEVPKAKVPNHYKGTSDIDLIEFFYQQWGEDALRAVTAFNVMRYGLRLGRKDKEAKELEKIIDYAERFLQKLE